VSLYPSPLQVLCAQDVTRHDILAGCTLRLPRKAEIDDHLLVGVDIDKGCFNHPIVVLSTDQVGGKATRLIVSIIQRSLSYHSNSTFPSWKMGLEGDEREMEWCSRDLSESETSGGYQSDLYKIRSLRYVQRVGQHQIHQRCYLRSFHPVLNRLVEGRPLQLSILVKGKEHSENWTRAYLCVDCVWLERFDICICCFRRLIPTRWMLKYFPGASFVSTDGCLWFAFRGRQQSES